MNTQDIKVAVLLSAYKGRRYFKEQIESIVDQEFLGKIIIYIREDGSGESLADILKTLQKENREIVYYEGKNLGPQKSFLKLIQDAPSADYYFFADQDDVWNRNKISRAVEKMAKQSDKYVLYCSDYTLVSTNLDVLRNKNVNVDHRTFHFLRIILYNEFPGCTMGFNYNMYNFLKTMNMESCMMHDSLALCTAAAIGRIIYDEEPTILHRIHGDNVVGYGHKKIKPMKWLKEKITLLIKKEDYNLSEMACRILEVGKEEVQFYKEDIQLLKDFKQSYRKTLELLRHADTKNVWDRTTLSIRCKILFHLF